MGLRNKSAHGKGTKETPMPTNSRGASPTSRASWIWPEATWRLQPDGVTLTWQSATGVTCFVERTTAIGQPFTTIAEGIADDTYTDTTAFGDGPFFYRVGVR